MTGDVSDPDEIARLLEKEDHPMGSRVRQHEGTGEEMIRAGEEMIRAGEEMIRSGEDIIRSGEEMIRAGEEAEAPGIAAVATVAGMDVSGHQGNVDWQHWWNEGRRFAYVKATEGVSFRNPYFTQQYNGSYNVGMIRGAYHFALPSVSGGADQANFFVDNGGGWSPDGRTLPGALDIEYNPYGPTCYGLSPSAMVAWIKSFSDTYHARTGRWPTIYTATSWWSNCTGNRGDFSSTNPLWLARYASAPGALPYNWPYHTFWQYTSTPIDLNLFNGAYDRLQALANG